MNCPTCDQGVPDDILTTLRIQLDWDDLYFYGVGHTKWVFELDSDIEVTAVKERSVDSYGYVNDDEIFVVVKVGDRHFKREGVHESYGNREWGRISEVTPNVKTVVTYDYN